jgi:hypothetical protein
MSRYCGNYLVFTELYRASTFLDFEQEIDGTMLMWLIWQNAHPTLNSPAKQA